MRTLVAAAAALIVSASSLPAQGVRLENGNFYVGYTDIERAAGTGLRIERTYNSKSPFKSIFGWGWATEYATYLLVMPDDSVTLFEHGGGRVNRFASPRTPARTPAAVGLMVDAAEESGLLVGAAETETFRLRLMADAELREREWENLLEHSLVRSHDVPVGTKLLSPLGHTLERRPAGYAWDNGSRTAHFDRHGRLRRILDGGRIVEIAYDAAGHLASVAEGETQIRFRLNDRGLVESIEGPGGQKAAYRYNDQDELVFARGADGLEFIYGYDAAQRHNLVRIGYQDGRTREIIYNPMVLRENTRVHKAPDGSRTEYDYASAWKNKDDYRVSVSVFDARGARVTRSTHRFVVTRDDRGVERSTELLYDEACRLVTPAPAALLQQLEKHVLGPNYPCTP